MQPPSPQHGETPVGDRAAALRIVDANANRALEGLRVVEEYQRFVLEDRYLTSQFKQLRHDLNVALTPISVLDRQTVRDAATDVGASITTSEEGRRESIAAVATASANRVQQALRSLEEYTKLLDADVAARIETLRYRTYTLARAAALTAASRERLNGVRLCVLVDGGPSSDSLAKSAKSLIDAGVDMLQLRDKTLGDRELVERAGVLREATQPTGTLLVINDRVDVAAAVKADGVHLGQDDLEVHHARRIVGPQMLIGVSTHSIEQARAAVLDGANYIGVGPTFPSQTKQFDAFPGLEYLTQVAAELSLPAFAIGGISLANLDLVLATGTNRVAVGAAVTRNADSAAAARRLRELLG